LTAAILVAGLAMVVGLAVLETRPTWRLPALAFGLLAMPGNVDDLFPQMTLDPHPLAGAMAPVLTFNDLLLAWALVLTIRERRGQPLWIRRLILLGIVLAGVASVSALVAWAGGVESGAVIRGVILFARIPAYLFLAGALRDELGDGSRLGLAIAAGGVFLLGNGIYTTINDSPDRFTARTFGRNGLAVALTVVVVAAAGLAFRSASDPGERVARWLRVSLCGLIAVASIFAMMQTGTRMALLLLLGAAVLAVLAYPIRIGPSQVRSIALTGVLLVATLAASSLTVAGSRTLSVIDPGGTVDAVGNLEDSAAAAEIRSRSAFWSAALSMAEAHPLFGVGPFQMNIERYVLDPTGPVVVADTHLTYLQIGAEFGFPTMALYVLLLAASLGTVVWVLRTREARATVGWTGLGIAIASLMFPVAALTNSHLFNPRNGSLEWLLIASAVGLSVAVAERIAVRLPGQAELADTRPATAASSGPDPSITPTQTSGGG
jgi:O-antigen ligase